MNYKLLLKIKNKEIVRGISQFKKVCRLLCGDCQVVKLTTVKHAQFGNITTIHVLQVMHIDIFGPAQIEIVGGKRDALICVDDFSKYAWIDFLLNNSESLQRYV